MSCDCISPSQPERSGGSTYPVVLEPGRYLGDGGLEPVMVDACIKYQMLALWMNGVRTVASCCSHNGKVGLWVGPSVVLEYERDLARTHEILSLDDRTWRISYRSGDVLKLEMSVQR